LKVMQHLQGIIISDFQSNSLHINNMINQSKNSKLFYRFSCFFFHQL
jgi:hypothetical protein